MSFQQQLDSFGSPLEALTQPVRPGNIFPYPIEHSNWRDEQRAWVDTAVLFNQSWHMNDLFISGPDAIRLLSETSANSYKSFRAGRAKQYLALAEDGYVIGDAIVFGLSEDLFAVVNGAPAAINWLMFQAETQNYDVNIELDPAKVFSGEGTTPKRLFRYELEGPNAQKILQKAAGREFEPIKFFRMGEIEIGGHTVRALNHTMAAAPGDENTGLELFGAEENHAAFLDAILEAGDEFGLRRGGALAYGSAVTESGWIALPVPAVYSSEAMRSFREWLPDDSALAYAYMKNGSFRPSTIDGYYMTPWDLGYGHMIKFDHDFIGRNALEKMVDEKHGQKVWLVWEPEDVSRVVIASELGDPHQLRPLDPVKGTFQHSDEVLVDGNAVGLTHMHGYTVNVGWASVATVKEEVAVEGAQVDIRYGDHDNGAASPYVPDHSITIIRATVRCESPAV